MSEIIGNKGTVLLSITTDINSFVTERRFATHLTISELKTKLELITGASNESMKLQLLDNNHQLIHNLDDNHKQLNTYLDDNQNKLNIHVIDDNKTVGEFEDISRVQKFELSREEYEKRSDSVAAFKMRNKLGRFGHKSGSDDDSTHCDIKVGERCEVSVKGLPKRRATVMFVGSTQFKSGVWVGVKYDEPLGKNDGSVDGKRYFDCQPKYGGFVRPDDLIVGHFPEIGLDFEEEMN